MRLRGSQRGNHVLDADIRDYFGSIDHGKLMTLVAKRVTDRRVLKLLRQWFSAGVMDEGEVRTALAGTPQGGVISPLLSNIYRNALDATWERRHAHLGLLVRHADDFVVMCNTQAACVDAEQRVRANAGALPGRPDRGLARGRPSGWPRGTREGRMGCPMVGCLVLMILVAGTSASGSAPARMFVEAELGGRWTSADWRQVWPDEVGGNVLGPGLTLGGNLGYMLTPKVGLVAHADVGFHDAPDDVAITVADESRYTARYTVEVVDRAWSLVTSLGVRFYPMAGLPTWPLQPYVGAGLGVGGMFWHYSDDFYQYKTLTPSEDGDLSVLVALEAGGDLKVMSRVSLGGGARYVLQKWHENSFEHTIDPSHLSGQGLSVQLHAGLHF